jgi:hypothetical protein
MTVTLEIALGLGALLLLFLLKESLGSAVLRS